MNNRALLPRRPFSLLPALGLSAAVICGCGDSPDKLFDVGVKRIKGRDRQGAREAFEAALALKPDLPQAHFALGKLHFHGKEYEEAAARYQAGLELDPANAPGHLSLGLTWYELERYPDSLRAFHKAMLIDPDLAPARYGMGRVYRAMGERARNREEAAKYTALALTYLLKTVEQQPGYFRAHELLGEIYEELAQSSGDSRRPEAIRQAIHYYKQASVLHSENRGALTAQVRLHSLLGDHEKVCDLVKHLSILARVDGTPLPPVLIAYRARSEEELGDYKAALESYALCLKRQEAKPPGRAGEEEGEAAARLLKEVHSAIARCKAKLGEEADALPKTPKREPTDPP